MSALVNVDLTSLMFRQQAEALAQAEAFSWGKVLLGVGIVGCILVIYYYDWSTLKKRDKEKVAT